MKHGTMTAPAVLGSVLTFLLLATGCATTKTASHNTKSLKSTRLAASAARRHHGDQASAYSLEGASSVNYKWLRKGQRTNGGPALDQY